MVEFGFSILGGWLLLEIIILFYLFRDFCSRYLFFSVKLLTNEAMRTMLGLNLIDTSGSVILWITKVNSVKNKNILTCPNLNTDQSLFRILSNLLWLYDWFNMCTYTYIRKKKEENLLFPPSCGNGSFMAEHWVRSFRNHCASRDYDIQRLRDVEPRCIVSVSSYTGRQFAFAGVEPVMRLSHTSSLSSQTFSLKCRVLGKDSVCSIF